MSREADINGVMLAGSSQVRYFVSVASVANTALLFKFLSHHVYLLSSLSF